MLTVNILTKDNYNFNDHHYSFMTNFNSIRREFDYATNYREDEPLPFTDEDSNKLFEAISKTEPYISEGFRRIDAYTFYMKYFGTDIISNLAPDIMLALLILKKRQYEVRIIVEDYHNKRY
ncbi:MAG: hypothetical protein E7478_01695 [Ruminococcaceae bacterium]|nr:hypothetical protein [Oscillospiraceae bacterium]